MMHRISGLAALVCGFGLPTLHATTAFVSPNITQILQNSSFETGDTTNWTVTDAPTFGDAGSFFVTNALITPLNGFPTVGPAAGSFYAVSDAEGPGSHALTQSFVDPLGTTSAILSFDVFVNDFFGGSGPGGEVDLLAGGADPILGTPIATFFSADTSVTGGNPNAWTLISLDIAGDMTPGQTYIIRVLETDISGPINVGADNFSLDVTSNTVPEPGMFLPVALIAGFFIYRNRRRAQVQS